MLKGNWGCRCRKVLQFLSGQCDLIVKVRSEQRLEENGKISQANTWKRSFSDKGIERAKTPGQDFENNKEVSVAISE